MKQLSDPAEVRQACITHELGGAGDRKGEVHRIPVTCDANISLAGPTRCGRRGHPAIATMGKHIREARWGKIVSALAFNRDGSYTY